MATALRVLAFRVHRAAIAVAPMALAGQASAASALMIWPIDPVIEHDQPAVALWVENRDKTPLTLQVRVVGWTQRDGQDVYDAAQNDIAGSPPMATVAPGKRQLIRLIKQVAVGPGKENAYRVFVDEIPRPDTDTESSQKDGLGPSLGIKFQMHYSIPLFVSGTDIWTKVDAEKRRNAQSAALPVLHWRIQEEGGKRWIFIRNSGAVHAKLTQMAVVTGERKTALPEGLFGYVLPGSIMRWEVPKSVSLQGVRQIVASVNGKESVSIASE
ncbi:fimbrial biogenesis chaperone [Cupriavidus sp. H39]|uniref:fimbrial biogenesis chaperone n=1 Tax=Cupriavidus sp. H39 TaxID=3401635 RepID=UPI003CFF6AF6